MKRIFPFRPQEGLILMTYKVTKRKQKKIIIIFENIKLRVPRSSSPCEQSWETIPLLLHDTILFK